MSLQFEILKNNKTFAVVGVSQDTTKYGHEIFETLLDYGYTAIPINPKYEMVDDIVCYPSIKALPEKPDVVVAVVPPTVTESSGAVLCQPGHPHDLDAAWRVVGESG